MSAHGDISAYANLSQDTRASKGLAASRWATGTIDDQKPNHRLVTVKAATDNASMTTTNSLANSRWAPGAIDDQEMANQQMNNIQASTYKAPKPTTNGLVNSRWAADAAEPYQSRNYNKDTKAQQKKYTNSMLKKPFRDYHDHKTTPTTNMTNAMPRRIIGPLSEEEKTVKMENPFFNPEKHKGLSSSRWAD
ncbi:hypothetical protein INS49_011479 [Diaporthe citri]|uniref:uncharacterized protein n=1 Tax=Diaporthe citri TaxID=83186 RepID=UPI001C81ADB3|nr:uncharacterized protein INS49_011479 [Diaporthe citri]KAG6360419.1 hypothetical protein INS49_011479 [Diaporthe citri]